jgi:hypothetical protein
MTTRTVVAAVLAAILTGCLTSPPPLTVARADAQRGAFGNVYMLDGTQHYGELLALDDSTVVLLTRDRIAIGALSRLSEMRFDDFETSDVGPERHLSARALRKGRQASRFPYGITAPAMANLLATAKQAAPYRLESWSVDAFTKEARAATRRYESQREAINDGFTRVGVEFPAMGEHWVSFARVNEDSLAANRPSVLIYTNVGGEPRLAGVAYTKLLTGRDSPPEFPFAGAWHEHSGAVNEESLPMGHTHGAVPSPSRNDVVPSAARDLLSPRLFILHAWLFVDNPEGIFATDNWSLPLTKLGLAAPPAERDGIHAIALAQDGDEYHRMVIRTTLKLSDHDDSAVARVIDTQRLRAEKEVAAIRASRRFTGETAARLSNTWKAMWLELERALPTRVAELRHLRAVM